MSTNFKDRTGEKFGRLTVIKRGPNDNRKRTRWYCDCDCGNKNILVAVSNLISRNSNSCGCYAKDRIKEVMAYRDFIDLAGMKFGRLTVIKRGENKGCHPYWYCECDCGSKNLLIRGSSLRYQTTVSCGCYSRELLIKRCTKHNLSKINPMFLVKYNSMVQRCYNSNNHGYIHYGARGIVICDRWLGKNGRINFYNDMFPTWKEGLSLDRINNDGNYSPENCKWSTIKEQINNRRITLKLNYNGQSYLPKELAVLLGMNEYTLRSRIFMGWSIDEIVNTPVRK